MRRGRNEGSYFQRPDGTWVGQLSIVLPSGKRIRPTVSAPTKNECRDALEALRLQHAQGVNPEPSKLTVGTFLAQWLAGRANIRDNTRAWYQTAINNLIKPEFELAGIPVTKLTGHHIQAAVAEMTKAGMGAASMKNARVTLYTALEAAATPRPKGLGLLAYNPVKAVEFKPYEAAERRIWNPEQTKTFLTHLDDHRDGERFEPLLTMCLKSGLRGAELLGLPWDAVDFTTGEVTVRQQLLEVDGEIKGIAPPKTDAALRTFVLPSAALSALRRRREWAMREGLAACEYVFVTRSGGWLAKNTVRKALYRLAASAGVPRITLHDLRHVFATRALESGVPMDVLKVMLGHEKIQTTIDTYGHVMPDRLRAAAKAIDGGAS